MNLKSCLMINNIEHKDTVVFVAKTIKTVLMFTRSCVTFEWFDYNNDGMIIVGSQDEIEIARLTFGQTLGLTVADDEVTMYPTIGQFHNVTINGSDQVVVPVSQVGSTIAGGIPTSIPTDAPAVIDATPTNDAHASMGRMLAAPIVSDSYTDRQNIARTEMEFLSARQLEGDTRWTTTFNRRMMALTPTESNSGTISCEEQILFSEERNPRRWNIAKCRYGNSRYYLSYLVPPTADMQSTLRVVGGVHNNETPDVVEICVFNSEPYWRELRHLMHRQAEFLREMEIAV